MDLKSEEIFSVGTWNGVVFSEADLDGLVAAFGALRLAGKVPNKFGHTQEQGMPAIGWVSRIWREGKKLLADFTDVPLVVYEAIKKGLYKFVSVELLRDVKAGTRTIPWVLDAVALLGADPPAVGDLKALQALTMSRSSGLQGRERVTFRRDDNCRKGDQMSVTEEEVKRRLEAQKAEFDRKEGELKIRLDNEAHERLKDRAAARRDVIKLKFDRKVEEKKLLPRSFEKFSALYRLSEDESAVKIVDADVEAFMAEREEVDAPVIRANDKGGAKDGKDTDEVETGTAVQITMARAQKECVARGEKVTDHFAMETATKIVFRRDGELAKAYFDRPDEPYVPKKEDKAA